MSEEIGDGYIAEMDDYKIVVERLADGWYWIVKHDDLPQPYDDARKESNLEEAKKAGTLFAAVMSGRMKGNTKLGEAISSIEWKEYRTSNASKLLH